MPNVDRMDKCRIGFNPIFPVQPYPGESLLQVIADLMGFPGREDMVGGHGFPPAVRRGRNRLDRRLLQ